MTSPEVSIICPVYNAEANLRRCLDSIISQTLTDWECILIDDGSTDSSGSICDDYVSVDSRFKVIHKPNGGVGAARQTGLETIAGQYVIHVDADDYIEPSMLLELVAKADSDKADIVICDYYSDERNRIVYKEQRPSSLNPAVVLQEVFGRLHASCWNKLIRRDCILKYNARFPEGINYSEDTCFIIQLLLHNVVISYLPKAFYHYVRHNASITHSFSRTTLDTCKKYVDFIRSLLPEDSIMVAQAKEMVKFNAFRSGILGNDEIKKLYPEIKTRVSSKGHVKLIYAIAYAGHQNMARFAINLNLRLRRILRGNCANVKVL